MLQLNSFLLYLPTFLAPADYEDMVISMSFTPGVSTQQAIVNIVDDEVLEFNETFFVNLRLPASTFGNILFQPGRAMATIVDNDGK